MKIILKKLIRISFAFILIAGMTVLNGNKTVYAGEMSVDETISENVEGDAEELPIDETIGEEMDAYIEETPIEESVSEEAKAQAEEAPTDGIIRGNGWTLDETGVFTVTRDISDEEVKKSADWDQYSEQIREVIVAEGVTTIPEDFMTIYPNLRKVTFSSTVKSIGVTAFNGSSIEEVYLNEGLEEIKHGAFAGTLISEIHFPSTLKKIGGDAFEDCDNLTTVTIPGNVESISSNAAFWSCDNLEEFIIEEGNLKELNLHSVGANPNLKKIWIPRTLEKIETIRWIRNACVIGYTGTAAEEICNRYSGTTDEYGFEYSMTFHAIDGDEHSYGDWQTVTAATCTENGLRKHACTICHTEQTEEIMATGHVWDGGTVTKEATIDAEGIKTYTCTTCKETKTEAIAKLASAGQGNVNASKTTTQGTTSANAPKTGDAAVVMVWLLTSVMSAGVVLGICMRKREKNHM